MGIGVNKTSHKTYILGISYIYKSKKLCNSNAEITFLRNTKF